MGNDSFIEKLENLSMKSNLYAWSYSLPFCHNTPSYAYISLTNVCNYKCVMCGHASLMRGDKGFMTFEVYKKIVNELPETITRVWLMKQGESLLHKEFVHFISFLKKTRPEIKIMLATNASALTKEVSEGLIKYADYLDIGLHSIEANTYKKITGKDTFDDVIDNISYLDSLLSGDSSLTYNITYVRQPANVNEKDDEVATFFKKKFKNADRIVIKWESNFQGEIEEANLNVTKEIDSKLFPKCLLPYTSLTYLYDGKVSYCAAEPKENYFIGDYNEKFSNIWNGNKMQEFRNDLNNGNFEKLSARNIECKNCSWPWSFETQNMTLFVTEDSKKLLEQLEKLSYTSSSDYAVAGLIYYLNADLAKSLEAFFILESSDSDLYLKELAKKWIGHIKKVYHEKFKHLNFWEKSLNAEGKSFSDLTRKIYKLNKDE